MSEKIIKSFLSKYEGLAKADLPPKVVDYYLDLSDIYLKFGELEQIKSSYEVAYYFFVKSLDLLKLYDDPQSRAVAEVYYMMANVADFDPKKAATCFYKTYLIMKKFLKKEFNEDFEVNIDFESVNKNDIRLDTELLIVKQDDKESVIELKEIMKELKQKVS